MHGQLSPFSSQEKGAGVMSWDLPVADFKIKIHYTRIDA